MSKLINSFSFRSKSINGNLAKTVVMVCDNQIDIYQHVLHPKKGFKKDKSDFILRRGKKYIYACKSIGFKNESLSTIIQGVNEVYKHNLKP